MTYLLLKPEALRSQEADCVCPRGCAWNAKKRPGCVWDHQWPNMSLQAFNPKALYHSCLRCILWVLQPSGNVLNSWCDNSKHALLHLLLAHSRGPPETVTTTEGASYKGVFFSLASTRMQEYLHWPSAALDQAGQVSNHIRAPVCTLILFW